METNSAPVPRPVSLVLALVPVIAAGILGNIATIPNIPGWYDGLVKPVFNPPNWIFGPVWTALYVLMTYAFYRILRQPKSSRLRSLAIAAFLIQIALNAAWPVAYFGAHSLALGVSVILPLWAAVATTLVIFWTMDPPAGWCFVPYLAWVSFAFVLNVASWQLNG